MLASIYTMKYRAYRKSTGWTRDILVRNSYHLCQSLFPLSLLVLLVLDGRVDEKKRDETWTESKNTENMNTDDKYVVSES